MDNQYRQIKGYRDLSQVEIDLMNEIKAKGQELDILISKVNEANAGGDRETNVGAECFRWAAIAKTDFQTGLMALTRAVAKPTPSQALPMIDAVAINSSSSANDTLPDTAYGSSSGFSEYFSRMEWLILDRLTWPMVQPPKRRSAISS